MSAIDSLSHDEQERTNSTRNDRTNLIDMPPVFAVIIEPLPYHLHYLGEGHHIVGQVRYLGHEGAGRAPGVVRGRLAHFDLENEFGIKVTYSFRFRSGFLSRCYLPYLFPTFKL